MEGAAAPRLRSPEDAAGVDATTEEGIEKTTEGVEEAEDAAEAAAVVGTGDAAEETAEADEAAVGTLAGVVKPGNPASTAAAPVRPAPAPSPFEERVERPRRLALPPPRVGLTVRPLEAQLENN